MIKSFFCGICEAPISGFGKTGCCRKCVRRQGAGPIRPKIEIIRASVLAGIRENIKTYGIRKECHSCKFDCKIPALPNSEMVFCPRVGTQL